MLARQEKWIMTRLLRKTHERLREFIRRQEQNYSRGTGKVIRGMQDGKVSLDAAIAELLRRDDEHRKRSAKVSKKRLAAKLAAIPAAVEQPE